jgi:hypothetical protein
LKNKEDKKLVAKINDEREDRAKNMCEYAPSVMEWEVSQ